MKVIEEKLFKTRNYYHKQLRGMLEELMFLSIDQDEEKQEELLEQFNTKLIILWRFDRKLKDLNAEKAASRRRKDVGSADNTI